MAGLLEESATLVLLQQVSHQAGRPLAQPMAPGDLERGEPRIPGRKKRLPAQFTLLPG